MEYPRKTKIICTVGPATRSVEGIEGMLRAGMNIARINFSHETQEKHGESMAMIRRAEERSGIPVAIMMDTKGPEIRTGVVAKGTTLDLRVGATVILTAEQTVATVGADGTITLSVSYGDLPQFVQPDNHIYISDGLIDLQVVAVDGARIVTTVRNGGVIGSRKNMNIPGVELPMAALSARDADDITFGLRQGIDFIAASFIRSADDVLQIRQLIERHGDSANGGGANGNGTTGGANGGKAMEWRRDRR